MTSQRVLKLFCIAVSLFSLSAIADDVAGSRDNPLLERYPRSTITNYQQRSNAEIWLLKSAIQTVNGSLRAKKADLLIGDSENISYRLPSSHTAADGYSNFEAAIVLLGGKPLYQCKSRGCGESADWANAIFNYSRLYGPDRGQLYGLYLLPQEDGHDRYVVLYAVTRGNGKAYVHLEFARGIVEERDVRWTTR